MLSSEVRKLGTRWDSGSGWPKRLSWLEIDGLRGWTGQRFDMKFPIMAVVGENGVGKSTILQCAASIYASGVKATERFASDFFPDTAWEKVRGAEIRYEVREGTAPTTGSIRKPTTRWRGNPQRRRRGVQYIDLSRMQPVPARVGYTRLANANFTEVDATPFELERLERFSRIMGREYDLAKMALTSGDSNRRVPVLSLQGGEAYSGFHQGAGETTIAELLEADLPKNGLILIDEVESSLHPRAQRRLIRDLADRCRQEELQVVLTTHSPYILEELPTEARAQILRTPDGRMIVYGVTPEFAMSKMDDEPHHECDVYVEDARAEGMLIEILTAHAPTLVHRCQMIRCGPSSVGRSLGEMVVDKRFPRKTCVILDGDNDPLPGCSVMPGDDAPEPVVFEALKATNWEGVDRRTGRSYSSVVDACQRAMLDSDHHTWVRRAADALTLGGDVLWQAMCAEWATRCLDEASARGVVDVIEYELDKP